MLERFVQGNGLIKEMIFGRNATEDVVSIMISQPGSPNFENEDLSRVVLSDTKLSSFQADDIKT